MTAPLCAYEATEATAESLIVVGSMIHLPSALSLEWQFEFVFWFWLLFFRSAIRFRVGVCVGAGAQGGAGWQSGIFSIIDAIIFVAKKRSSCKFAVNIKWRIQIRIGGRRQRARNAAVWGIGECSGMENREWWSGWNETIVMQICPAITVHGRTVEAQSKAKLPARLWGKSALLRRGGWC